jgi:glycosyltransferase involved in cell wall biosynthesis
MKTVIVSRKFDIECGSAVWMLAEKRYQTMDKTITKKVEQKVNSKILHDWFILPILCLWYRLRGYKHFIFMSENQAWMIFILNLTFTETTVYINDFFRIQNERKGLDHLYFYIIYWLALRAKNIIAISYKTAEEILEYYGDHLNEKVTIEHPYFEMFKMDKSNRRYNVIGYLGSLCSRKRVLRLLDVAQYIKQFNLNYIVEVWGEGELYEVMKEQMAIHKLNNVMILKGHAPEKDKEKIYNSFGYFFFPSEKEGFGIPAFDAISCGVPTFVYRDSEITYEIKDNCILIEYVDDMFENIKCIEEDGYGK